MQRIPFFKQAAINKRHSEAAIAAITAMASGQSPLVLGHYSRRFEQEFQHYLNCQHFSFVSNGLEALVLALQALEIRPGDEVIVPAHTYIATWLAPLRLDCQLVACPVKEESLLLDEEQLPSLLTSRTRCIMPVHLYGNACNMEAIMDLAADKQLKVIEDAAQAHGARDSVSGLRIGCHGDAVAFSFYPTKNLGAMGEGGGIASKSEQTAKRIDSLRNYGRNAEDGALNDLIGTNARGDEVQAALLSSKLQNLDQINQHRREHIRLYTQLLNSASIPASLISYTDQYSAPHLAVLRCHKPVDRNRLMESLHNQGIDTAVHYRIPCHQQPCIQAAGPQIVISESTQDQAQNIADSILSLPMSECHNEDEVRRVAHAVLDYFKV